MDNRTTAERREDEKRVAALWLYIASKGLLNDFTEFYRQRRDRSLAEIDQELRQIANEKPNILTKKQTKSTMSYKEITEGDLISIVNEDEGIGLRFKKGESLQRYTSSILVKDKDLLTTEEGCAKIIRISNEITEYAAQQYPEEFKKLSSEEMEQAISEDRRRGSNG
jgi:hypothetical protein